MKSVCFGKSCSEVPFETARCRSKHISPQAPPGLDGLPRGRTQRAGCGCILTWHDNPCAMAAMSTAVLLVTAAYLLGSISSAIIVCRLMGLPDPRTQGSNNPGATNVLRIGGKKAAAITLLGDSLKGLIPVLAGHLLGAAGGAGRRGWRPSSATCTRCSSASGAARAWPPRSACSSAWTG